MQRQRPGFPAGLTVLLLLPVLGCGGCGGLSTLLAGDEQAPPRGAHCVTGPEYVASTGFVGDDLREYADGSVATVVAWTTTCGETGQCGGVVAVSEDWGCTWSRAGDFEGVFEDFEAQREGPPQLHTALTTGSPIGFPAPPLRTTKWVWTFRDGTYQGRVDGPPR
ncbi:MAG: hypothetical protein EP330_07290 [Deltaproteobacteria bacterium]|nr:MAG: hypothetical protein EP330_07290 [Deltaproteobacteria bacterium]